MQKKEYEMPNEYKKNLGHLNYLLESREGYRKTIREGLARGVKVSPSDKALVDEKLSDLDRSIDEIETQLAKEYEQYQAEQAKQEQLSDALARAWEGQKKLYIIIKHQKPHLLKGFTECLDPLNPEQREQFFDEVAILEATDLKSILEGNK